MKSYERKSWPESASRPSVPHSCSRTGNTRRGCQPVPRQPILRDWRVIGCSPGVPPLNQVAERVVIDKFLRALPRSLRQAAGMRNPLTIGELVEAIELADAAQHRDAGERVPPFPRRVVRSDARQRAPHGQ